MENTSLQSLCLPILSGVCVNEAQGFSTEALFRQSQAMYGATLLNFQHLWKIRQIPYTGFSHQRHVL